MRLAGGFVRPRRGPAGKHAHPCTWQSRPPVPLLLLPPKWPRSPPLKRSPPRQHVPGNFAAMQSSTSARPLMPHGRIRDVCSALMVFSNACLTAAASPPEAGSAAGSPAAVCSRRGSLLGVHGLLRCVLDGGALGPPLPEWARKRPPLRTRARGAAASRCMVWDGGSPSGVVLVENSVAGFHGGRRESE